MINLLLRCQMTTQELELGGHLTACFSLSAQSVPYVIFLKVRAIFFCLVGYYANVTAISLPHVKVHIIILGVTGNCYLITCNEIAQCDFLYLN